MKKNKRLKKNKKNKKKSKTYKFTKKVSKTKKIIKKLKKRRIIKKKDIKVKKFKRTIYKSQIKKPQKDSILLKLVKFQLSLKPQINFNFDFGVEKTIQGFFDKISEIISRYKILKNEEKRRVKLEKIEKERKEKIKLDGQKKKRRY